MQPARLKNVPPLWRECASDLHAAYGGVCAYLCVFIEVAIGGATVDHFVPKASSAARLIYEWSNYRLACSRMNQRKRASRDVLDPFRMTRGTFRLELVTGRVFPRPGLSRSQALRARSTIERLRLDDAECRDLRARHYQDYCERRYDSDFLSRYSPFVWAEAKRQGLL